MAETSETKTFTKREVAGFLADITEQVKDTQGNYLHSLIALNELLSQPNADKIFDAELKTQAKEIWVKLKSSGLELNDPPLLFGAPEVEDGKKAKAAKKAK